MSLTPAAAPPVSTMGYPLCPGRPALVFAGQAMKETPVNGLSAQTGELMGRGRAGVHGQLVDLEGKPARDPAIIPPPVKAESPVRAPPLKVDLVKAQSEFLEDNGFALLKIFKF